MTLFEFTVFPRQGYLIAPASIRGFESEGNAEGFQMLLEEMLTEAVENGSLTSFEMTEPCPIDESHPARYEPGLEDLSPIFDHLIESVTQQGG